MNSTQILMVAALLSSGAFAPAIAGHLPSGAVVRIEGTSIESGWHAGKVVQINGCSMVALDKPTKDKYTLISYVAVARLQRQNAGTWQEISIATLRAGEAAECLEEGTD